RTQIGADARGGRPWGRGENGMLGNVDLLAVGKSRFHQLGEASRRCKAPHQLQPRLAAVLWLVIEDGRGDISESSDHGAAAIGIWQHVGAVCDAAPGHCLAVGYRAANNGHLTWPQSTRRWTTKS